MLTEPTISSLPWGVVIPWQRSDLDAMRSWCEDNIGPRVVSGVGYQWRDPLLSSLGDGVWRFRSREAAVLFGMVWA